MVTNPQSGTNVFEISSGIYRINTPVSIPGGPEFNFNQYLVVDEQPLLFHTGPRKMFPLIREAIERVMPVERLHYIGISHFEADECGALNEFLTIAPRAVPLCGSIAAMVSVNDVADRPARALADGETLALGKHTMRWFDTPHMPHAWECGMMMDTSTRTFFCGDLFTQGGAGDPPLTEADARVEASRCLLCGLCANCNTCVEVLACPAIARDAVGGKPHVLTELCTGCGACVQACPNEAIGGCG